MRRRWRTSWRWCCPTSWRSPRARTSVHPRCRCACRDATRMCCSRSWTRRGRARRPERSAGGAHGWSGAGASRRDPGCPRRRGRDRTAQPAVEFGDDIAARGGRARPRQERRPDDSRRSRSPLLETRDGDGPQVVVDDPVRSSGTRPTPRRSRPSAASGRRPAASGDSTPTRPSMSGTSAPTATRRRVPRSPTLYIGVSRNRPSASRFPATRPAPDARHRAANIGRGGPPPGRCVPRRPGFQEVATAGGDEGTRDQVP